jgi:hypothetical protein
MPKKLTLPIPDQVVLENRFNFIHEDLLRTNLSISFRYVIFLVLLESEYDLPGAISYSLYKNIILFTATIIESCLHYCLRQYLDKGVIKSSDIMPWEWMDDSCKELYKIDETQLFLV